MSKINNSLVLDAISIAINKVSPTSSIYIDKVEQGLNNGDFIVRLINAEYIQHGNEDLYRVVPAFDVIYFPENGNKDCMNMGDKLSHELSVIELPTGDLLRATNKGYEIVDEVLHFKISYPYNTISYRNDSGMDELKVNQGG